MTPQSPGTTYRVPLAVAVGKGCAQGVRCHEHKAHITRAGARFVDTRRLTATLLLSLVRLIKPAGHFAREGRIKPPSFVLCSFCSTTLRVSVSFQGTAISQEDRDHDNITRYLLSSSFLKTPTCCCISRWFSSSLPRHTGILRPQSFLKHRVLPNASLGWMCKPLSNPISSLQLQVRVRNSTEETPSSLLRKFTKMQTTPGTDRMLYFTRHVKTTKITFSMQ